MTDPPWARIGSLEDRTERPGEALEKVRRRRRAIAEDAFSNALKSAAAAEKQLAHHPALTGVRVELYERVGRVIRGEAGRLTEGAGAAREDGVVAHGALLPRLDLGQPKGTPALRSHRPGATETLGESTGLLPAHDSDAARRAVVTDAARPRWVTPARPRSTPVVRIHTGKYAKSAVGDVQVTRVRSQCRCLTR